MKISKLFHYLYAALCFLPLLIIPVFMLAVRSDNNFEPITISTSGYEINNKYETNEVNNYNDLQNGNIYSIDLNTYYDNLIDYTNDIDFIYIEYIYYSFGDTNVFEIDDISYTLYLSDFDGYLSLRNEDNDFAMVLPATKLYLVADWNDIGFDLFQYNIIPNKSDYNVLEYVYNEGIVYNDTDVGSQLLYTCYVTTDKYMNFDEVLNLGAISDWIEFNVFNGNAPLIWTIIWHYLDYWLLLSIFWLCFDVLIYVPLLAHRWLDKASLE